MGALKAVDFFCSGGGMSYGLSLAGINVIAGIDIDIACKETYVHNIPTSKFIHEDITKLKKKDLGKYIGLKRNDKNLIFIGCSPCQFWSIINTDKAKSRNSRNLLKEFERFVIYYKPGYVVIENVPGIYYKREESGLNGFIDKLKRLKYLVEYNISNLNNYGVPQNRKRFTLIAGRNIKNPIKLQSDENNRPIVLDFIGQQNGIIPIQAGYRDDTDFIHTASTLSKINLKRIKSTPINGGLREAWANTSLQLETYKKRDNNSFRDTYGRMSWDKPAPTITTKFFSLSNGRFGHPDEDRAISLREGARLQTFPDSFKFKSNTIGGIAKIIGNAVPPEYAKRIGQAIIKG